MRIRSKFAAIAVDHYYQSHDWVGDHWITRGESPNAHYSPRDSFEYMVDDASHQQYLFHDCYHIRRVSNYDGLVDDGAGLLVHSAFVPICEPVMKFQAFLIPIQSIVQGAFRGSSPNPTWSELAFVSRGGLRAILENEVPHDVAITADPLNKGFSVLNVVVDILQLSSLESVFRMLARANRRTLGRMGSFAKANPHLTAKDIADSHLAVQFGILPTLRDLRECFQAISRFVNCQKLLKEFSERRHVFHLPVETLPTRSILRTYEYISHTPLSDVSLSAQVLDSYRANRTCAYSASFPELQGFCSRLKQFVDVFGLVDPAAVWDVIPFSFVLDWFVGFGGWLHENRPRLFPVDVVVEGYCESLKLIRNIQWGVTCEYASLSASLGSPRSYPVNDILVASEIVTAYLRYQREPVLKKSLPRKPNSAVNLRRVLISASLVSQRVPRRSQLSNQL